VNTGTFHIILNSGQAHNFIAASLRPADSQSIIDALRKALK
jgi:cellobiose-specific phosphotransferase system component IIA